MTILRDLILEAMEVKAKKQQEQQRELEEEEENSVRGAGLFSDTSPTSPCICTRKQQCLSFDRRDAMLIAALAFSLYMGGACYLHTNSLCG